MDHKDIRLARLERNFRHLAEETAAQSVAEAARSKQAVVDARAATLASVTREVTPKRPTRGRAAVVTWDLGHNPVGRAYVLYRLLEKDWDVDLIGPMWSRYGTALWEPLRDSGMNVRSFRCSSLAEFVPKAEVLAATRVYDIVYVCKPRLPSLYLGALLKDSSDCPLVLDVDDFELSFFEDESTATLEEVRAAGGDSLNEPFEQLGTRYAQSLIAAADAVTVSNVALRKRFGGHIVRHARDEVEFANTPERRRAARERLGIAESDFALMFIGTPRPHKGVIDVARALETIGDPSMVFHIVGDIGERQLRETLRGFSRARVVLHPNCAFDELPELLAGADLVPLIQDVAHPISQFQIPAKISDALSLGVPVLATRTPPLLDLLAAGIIHETDVAGLPDAIRRLAGEAADRTADRTASGAANGTGERVRARRDFVNELGASVNRTRLEMAIDEAGSLCAARAAAGAEALESGETAGLTTVVRPWSPPKNRRASDPNERDLGEARLVEPLADMVELFRERYRDARLATLAETAGQGAVEPESVPARFPSIIRSRATSYDIAFFWKQNDSGLYGRRSDMVARYLAASGRVNRLVHFDAPMSAPGLGAQFTPEAGELSGQKELVLGNLVDRQCGIQDTAITRARTFLGSGHPRRGRFLGRPVAKPESYVRFVSEQLEEAGMRAGQTIAWFCPVVWNAQELIDKVGFGGVVADLIDDQRAWDANENYRKKLDASYRETLQAADLVFANCDALAEAMSEYSASIHVVPNGAERFGEFPPTPRPERLAGIEGPIAGYVGNLRDRIDWMLLHHAVAAMPDVQFVFFGPSSDNPNADSLAKHPNVHILGILPYAELHRYLRAFDVGLVPHVSNRLTERMNPLKVYNYFAAGLPIVSTEVDNLGDLGSALHVASDATEFVRGVRAALTTPVDVAAPEWQRTMDSIAWDTRAANMLTVMDRSLRGAVRKSA